MGPTSTVVASSSMSSTLRLLRDVLQPELVHVITSGLHSFTVHFTCILLFANASEPHTKVWKKNLTLLLLKFSITPEADESSISFTWHLLVMISYSGVVN